MTKILIQANNLDTVIDVFSYICYHPGWKKQDVADFCDFTLRQVDYYTNACKYLDLLDSRCKLTELGKDIFENSPAEITERIYDRIIHDDIMGQVYQYLIHFPDENPYSFSLELTKKVYPGYSQAVYERRSSNIVNWCKKINEYLKSK